MINRVDYSSVDMTAGRLLSLDAIVQRLVEEYQPDKIFLFGSYAYGQPHKESDLDLLVIKDSPEDRRDRESKVSKIIAPARHGISVDMFVLTPSELDIELRKGNQFYQEIVSRGLLLYGEKETYPMVDDSSPYAQSWLSVALDDIQAAELILDHDGPANAAGIHVQKALEKYLKAYLLFRGWRLKRTHDLAELLEDAIPHDPTFEEYCHVCEEVTKYYLDDRYPERRRELTHHEVQSTLDQVRPLVDKIVESGPK